MAADTNTPRPTLTKQGQCGHCCSERDSCSQSMVEARNRGSCSLKHSPGHSCFHTCTQDAQFEGAEHMARQHCLNTHHWSLFYICLSSACWSHAWCSGSRLDISYWLQLDLNCVPTEQYCGGSLWKSSDRTAFSWDSEASCMTQKHKLEMCWELKIVGYLWVLTC